jgi:hypothetical protein
VTFFGVPVDVNGTWPGANPAATSDQDCPAGSPHSSGLAPLTGRDTWLIWQGPFTRSRPFTGTSELLC